ncbi:MAG: class I SAM-dependent methyltransferase [Myxococcales bacterium]
MNERLQKWDEKFSRGEEVHGFAPSAPLPGAIAGLSPGLALDLASGAGRHALFLAEHGWRVRALDGSQIGIDRMMEEARRRGVEAFVDARVADLESDDFALDGEAFDLVCDFYFLHRPLFEQIRRAVRPGGLFVAAIHVQAETGAAQHGFLLRPGELRATVEGWGFDILHAREGGSTEAGHHHATAEIVARKPANR